MTTLSKERIADLRVRYANLSEVEELLDAYEHLAAERDRLRTEINRMQAEANGMAGSIFDGDMAVIALRVLKGAAEKERDRLRTALEAIAYDSIEPYTTIARRALEGDKP